MKLEEVKDFTYETLIKSFGKSEVNRRDDGTIWFKNGSAIVEINYFGHNNAYLILIFSKVALNVPYSEDLIKFLLNLNLKIGLGCLGFQTENDSVTIILKTSLMPEFTKKEELEISVLGIAKIADDLDDKIVEKFGGEKMSEFIERIQKEMESGNKLVN